MKCVYKKFCYGYDWHDISVWEEMLVNPESTGSRFDFSGSDEKKYILQDIFREFGTAKDEQAPADVVYDRSERCYYESSTFVEGKTYKIEVEWRGHGFMVYAYEPDSSQAIYSVNYFICEFGSKDDVCYCVLENFLAPYKGVPSLERMYRDVFMEEAEALKYYESMTLRKGFGSSVKQLMVVEKTVLGNKFYELNRQAIRLMEETGETPDSDSFCIPAEEHIAALQEIKNAKAKE